MVGSGNTTFCFVARNALLSFLNSIVEIGNFLFIGCHTLTQRFSEYLLILKCPIRFFHIVLELLNKIWNLIQLNIPTQFLKCSLDIGNNILSFFKLPILVCYFIAQNRCFALRKLDVRLHVT